MKCFFFKSCFYLIFYFCDLQALLRKVRLSLRIIIIVIIKFCKKDPVSFYVVRKKSFTAAE